MKERGQPSTTKYSKSPDKKKFGEFDPQVEVAIVDAKSKNSNSAKIINNISDNISEKEISSELSSQKSQIFHTQSAKIKTSVKNRSRSPSPVEWNLLSDALHEANKPSQELDSINHLYIKINRIINNIISLEVSRLTQQKQHDLQSSEKELLSEGALKGFIEGHTDRLRNFYRNSIFNYNTPELIEAILPAAIDATPPTVKHHEESNDIINMERELLSLAILYRLRAIDDLLELNNNVELDPMKGNVKNLIEIILLEKHKKVLTTKNLSLVKEISEQVRDAQNILTKSDGRDDIIKLSRFIQAIYGIHQFKEFFKHRKGEMIDTEARQIESSNDKSSNKRRSSNVSNLISAPSTTSKKRAFSPTRGGSLRQSTEFPGTGR
ncbi:hypothetical protein SZ25_00342 [Candidatus Arcanobacter lacustris]|uniref:Uncharacterized protein n=1 Tax=Candidatus Arcanibacter lacustris TaxID=1607817 RepID=A0A0F5MP50_9RICK|nr:hypothetical protein SZ25_00342 [Candidatus Arcanobacter lacustris]